MSLRNNLRPALRAAVILGVVAAGWAAAPAAQAGTVAIGDAANYTVLFEGNDGNKIELNNSRLVGNLGVGLTGLAKFAGGDLDVYGNVDFSAANTGQFTSSGYDVWTGTDNYNVAAVTSALTRINALSEELHDAKASGTSITIDSATQTINATDGNLVSVTFDGQTQSFRLFTVTSGDNLSNGSGVLTINGSANDLIAFNLEDISGSEIQFKGDIVLTGGITADNIVWNLGGGNYSTLSGGKKLTFNNTLSQNDYSRGIFLNPNGQIFVSDSHILGRVFGGDTQAFQYVSGADVEAPTTVVPLPSSAWMGLSLFGVLGALGAVRRRRQRSELI